MTIKENTGKFQYLYGYDLRNRLASANITRKEGLQDVTITSSYTYNTAGIRTRAEQTINGVTQNRYFLLDSGHTGYSQVFEETSSLGGNLVRSYVLGDDVLSQNVGGVTSHLLYDGHGSTRQLANSNGEITDNYAYDAYGKMLGGDPNVTDRKSATDLLYAGEQFDAGLQMEYLRAHYYDQNNGRFNRLDPFEGNSKDPQSLHKYAYCHADPVNAFDPAGEMALLSVMSTMTITSEVFSWYAMGAGVALRGIQKTLGSSPALQVALSVIEAYELAQTALFIVNVAYIGIALVYGSARFLKFLAKVASESQQFKRAISPSMRFARTIKRNYKGAPLVRSSLPELTGSVCDAFDAPIETVTLKKGEILYRTPGKFGDNQWNPGKWFGAEPSKSKLDNELKYYIEIWDNPNEIQFIYRL